VAGAWKVETRKLEKGKRAATLVVEPFAALAPPARMALAEEGERLVRFVEDGAAAYEVRFTE
jgi:hypothetical protein